MLVLTRQALPTLCREKHASAKGVQQGAYTLKDCDGAPQVLLLGTGSEVGLCLAAQETLAAEGIAARVVSMPCWKLFDEQDMAYRNDVLPPQVTARVGVEAGLRMGWDRYIGADGRFVGMEGFGASAPADELFEHFGITVAHVVMAAKEAIENSQPQ
jgi:transketolase